MTSTLETARAVRRNMIDLLANKWLLHVTLPAIMLFLVWGTLAQKSLGLYEATHRFFLAPFLYFHGIPLPGMPLFMGLLAVNLVAHLCRKGKWAGPNFGTTLTHFGVILILCGALLTSLTAQEGYLNLGEGAQSNHVSDYHVRVVVIRNLTRKEAYAIPFNQLIAHEGEPQNIHGKFRLTVKEICRNCTLSRREQVDARTYGMARGMKLAAKPLAAENEENMAGISFEIEGAARDGLYTAIENVAVVPQFTAGGEAFTVSVEKEQRLLPFTVELVSTERTLYPGSDEAKSYQSQLRIHDHGRIWDATLSMNQPLRYKGYALFQSSYIEDTQGRRSIIAVVHNPIRTFPYIAGVLIALGMGWHLLLRLRGAAMGLLFFLACLEPLLSGNAQAATITAYHLLQFSRLPVASDGRIKPIDSVAREQIGFMSGSERRAAETFFTLMFFPEQAATQPLIKVANSGVRTMLALPPAPKWRYSAVVIGAALDKHKAVLLSLLDKPEGQLTEEQRQLRDTYARFNVYQSISHSFDAYRPLRAIPLEMLPEKYQRKFGSAGTVSFENSARLQTAVEQETKALVKRKGTDIARYTPEEKALAYFSYTLALLRNNAERTAAPNLIHDATFAQFISPWDIVLKGKGGPGFTQSLSQWKELIGNAQDPAAWNATVQQMLQQFPAPMGYRVEWYSNHIPLTNLALLGYALALLVLIAAYVLQRDYRRLGYAALGFAVGSHFLVVLTRIVILSRPPVGTLYESVLFAGLVVAGWCYWRFRRTRQLLWLWQAALGGLMLLLLALANDLVPGDNKTMLTAVLNTNFWLTIHVLTITAGYAFSILTALLAHRLLWSAAQQPALYDTLKRTALVALLLCATGTMLGGIWADQSWGRFWGWDPKENGALLIVLWLVWFLHGNVTNSMPRLMVIVGFALVGVVVGLSWFGVNLLNIGLHSYGFTQGVQRGLAGFVALELLLVGALASRHYRREKRA